jgi:hypothetical protein
LASIDDDDDDDDDDVTVVGPGGRTIKGMQEE